MSVNGKKYDWEDMSVMLPHGVAAQITEIKYSDEQAIVARYGRGSTPLGFGRGNYAATFSFVLDREEWELLKKQITPVNGGIYDHDPFTIVSSYANNDQPAITDTLKKCKIAKFDGGGGSQGDDNVSPITCEGIILEPILWNGVPAKRTSKAVTL